MRKLFGGYLRISSFLRRGVNFNHPIDGCIISFSQSPLNIRRGASERSLIYLGAFKPGMAKWILKAIHAENFFETKLIYYNFAEK
jgi:hypothetical protein